MIYIKLNFFIFLQAGALVNIYLDGSVLVTHGGIELGQGLFTKMIQVTLMLKFFKMYTGRKTRNSGNNY